MIALESHVEVLSALRLGWTVRAELVIRVNRLTLDPKATETVEFAVYDAREVDIINSNYDGEYQVLTLQGWHTPTHCWAIEGEQRGVRVDAPTAEQEPLFK